MRLFFLWVSLVRLAKKIEDHKKEITRAKRKAERELKKSVSSYRSSPSTDTQRRGDQNI